MYRFLHNDFYFNDRFLLVNLLELALRYIYGFYSIQQRGGRNGARNAMACSPEKPCGQFATDTSPATVVGQ